MMDGAQLHMYTEYSYALAALGGELRPDPGRDSDKGSCQWNVFSALRSGNGLGPPVFNTIPTGTLKRFPDGLALLKW